MKKIPKIIQVDKYTDDNNKPVCGECEWNPRHSCMFAFIDADGQWSPDADCPIWK
jgi:hypothetical protein